MFCVISGSRLTFIGVPVTNLGQPERICCAVTVCRALLYAEDKEHCQATNKLSPAMH